MIFFNFRFLTGTAIKHIPKDAFAIYPNLTSIFFRECVLESLEPGAFSGLDSLTTLGMLGCDRLKTVERGVFGSFKSLQTLQIFRSGLMAVPNLESFNRKNPKNDKVLIEMDFSVNKIQEIKEFSFMHIRTHILNLETNRLRRIDDHAFSQATISELLLADNPQLTQLGEYAFDEITGLTKILHGDRVDEHLQLNRRCDLSGTSITHLPTKGLSMITHLYLSDTKSLRHFPSVLKFEKIKTAQLYYPHHCCVFKTPEKQNPRAYEEFQRRIQQDCASSSASPTNIHLTTTIVPGFDNFQEQNSYTKTYSRNKRFGDLAWSNFEGRSYPLPPQQLAVPPHASVNQSLEGSDGLFGSVPSGSESRFGSPINASVRKSTESPNRWFPTMTIPSNSSVKFISCGNLVPDFSEVVCSPEPDAFNPCEDVMGYEWLRIFVWLVVMAALFGNAVVLLVLIKSRSKMTVQKFLMCNLAFADFLMGTYLLLLASIDIRTLGEYFNYAILWQNEGGCQAAGFLTVFSCELSIYTLTLITLERWYAISHAIHLTKRLKLRQAAGLMAIGWIYAMFMAILPLVGISDYGNVSICLPMKVEKRADLAYIITILIINGLAFLIICVCYVNMYFKVRKSDSTARSSDATIAKRMAMLVFTNFVCWAPIAFFGLTASAGLPLIDITHSKILLVFFYPLNSFSNPYLYVIITKQFRKDLFFLLAKYGICTEMANRYKDTVSTKSMTQSRKDSVNLHNVIHPVDGSLSQFTGSFRSSRNSFKNGTPTVTPNGTPNIEKSVRMNTLSVEKQNDRKLSLVRETSSLDNDCGSSSGTDKPQYHSGPLTYVRSDYVVLYPPPRNESYDKSKPAYNQQTSGSSNATDSTYISDTGAEDVKDDEDCYVTYFETITEDISEDNDNLSVDNRLKSYLNSTKKYFNYSSDDSDDDNVQQTLLKHSTLRDSPAAVHDDKLSVKKSMSDGAFCSFGCDVQYKLEKKN